MKKNGRYLPYIGVGLSALALFIIVTTPTYVLAQQDRVEADGFVEELAGDIVIEQQLALSNVFDWLGVRVATYTQLLYNGSLKIELYNENEVSVGTVSLNADELHDNEMIWLKCNEMKAGNYKLAITVNGFPPGEAPTLYSSSKLNSLRNETQAGAGIAYETVCQQVNYDFNWLTFWAASLALCVLLMVRNMAAGGFTRLVKGVASGLLFLLAVFCLCAYLVTGTFKPGALIRLCVATPDDAVQIDIENISNATNISYRYRHDGTAHTKFYTTWLDQIQSQVCTITYVLKPQIEKKQYGMTVFSENRGTLRLINQDTIVHSGKEKNSVCVDVPISERIRVDYGETSDFGDLRLAKNPIIYDKIIINDRQEILRLKEETVGKALLSFIIVASVLLLAVVCRRFQMANRLLAWEKRHRITPEKRFLVWGLLFGVVFLVMLPIYQAPDEAAHLGMISSELGYSNLTEKMVSSISLYKEIGHIAGNTGEKLSVDAYLHLLNEPFQGPVGREGYPSIQLLRHLPQAVGVQIALVLGLPAFWVFMMGRLGGLLFYLAIGYLSIKLVPFKKNMVMLCLISPMMIQMASSLNYDCALLALSMLLFCYILFLAVKSGHCGWRELMRVGLILFVILIIKPNYVLLGLLIFLIPISKWRLPIGKLIIDIKFITSHRILSLTVLLTLVVGALVILCQIEFGKLLISHIIHPVHFMELLLKTLQEKYIFYFRSIFGNFGWLDTSASLVFCSVATLMLLVASKAGTGRWSAEANLLLTHSRRILMGSVGLAVILSCFIGMTWWSFKIYRIEFTNSFSSILQAIELLDMFEGVQGRYFLPIVPVVLMLIKPSKRLSEGNARLISMIGQVYLIGYTWVLLANRYWMP